MVVALALLGSLHFHLERQGYYNLNEFEIEVVNRSDESARLFQHLTAVLAERLRKFHGQSLWSLPLEDVSRELAQQTWIDSFKVVRVWPDRVQLKLFAGEIAFNFVKSSRRSVSQIFPVTWQGKILEPVNAQLAPLVPFVNSREIVETSESLARTLNVLKEIPQEGMFSRNKISEMGFKKNDGYWVQLINSDILIQLGEDHIARKSRRLSQVLDYLENQEIDVRVIDANLSKKVLVRLRKDF
jgi:cell division protein FtsQ